MNIDVLRTPIEVTDNPGLDTTDPRLEEIASLAQDGNYLDAAAQAQAVFEEGVYDIRLLGFFCYGLFLEAGVKGLAEIFAGLVQFLSENWAAVGPVQKREKHAQTSLRWFFNQVLKKLQHEESVKGEVWNGWLAETTSDDVERVLEEADSLRRALAGTLEEASGPIMEGLTKTVEWLRPFQQLVYREPEPEAVPEPEPPAAEEPEEVVPNEASRPMRAEWAPADRSGDGETVWVEGSYHLKLLMRKLAAFERLIAEGKLPRAALVADDIMEIITQFDPRIYIPKIFGRFFMLLAMHSDELSGYADRKDSPEWQAMKEFLKVDLDGFVDL